MYSERTILTVIDIMGANNASQIRAALTVEKDGLPEAYWVEKLNQAVTISDCLSVCYHSPDDSKLWQEAKEKAFSLVQNKRQYFYVFRYTAHGANRSLKLFKETLDRINTVEGGLEFLSDFDIFSQEAHICIRRIATILETREKP